MRNKEEEEEFERKEIDLISHAIYNLISLFYRDYNYACVKNEFTRAL